MLKTMVWQLWMVYAAHSAPLGVFETQAECESALAGAQAALVSRKPAMACVPTRLVTHITVRDLGVLP